MSLMHSQTAASTVIASILAKMDEQIAYKQLLSKIPHYLHYEFMNETYAKFDSMHKQHDQVFYAGMQEQYVTDMNCLVKDSLMPKGVQRESQQVDKMTMDLDKSLKPKKKVLFGTRSSFKNKSLMNATNKTSNLSISSNRRKKKQMNENFISLQVNNEDPEIVTLWKKKNFQILEREKERKQEQQKIRLFKEKKELFQKEYVESSKNYTFDLEGVPFSYDQKDQKIHHHSMRTRLGIGERKLKNNVQKNDDSIISDVKVKNKKSLRQDSVQASLQFNLNIPVFQSQAIDSASLYGIPTEMGKYHLKDYRKHYGGRYNRLEKSLNTIDLHSQKNDEYNNIFSERRHFRDEDSINQSMISYRSRQNSPMRRKLALPKIKGKYSTLDRYEDIMQVKTWFDSIKRSVQEQIIMKYL